MIGANVTGVNLSTDQLQVSNARASEKGLTRSAKFLFQDYRDVPGPFDRIVSVGMFEHIGVDFYETYFRRWAELLTDDRVMMLHSVGRSDGPDATTSWIRARRPSGFDIEILRLHYAETLKAWRERFMARVGGSGTAL